MSGRCGALLRAAPGVRGASEGVPAQAKPAARDAHAVIWMTPLFCENVVFGGVRKSAARSELMPSARRPPWMRDIVAFEDITSSSDLVSELAEYAAVIEMSPEGMEECVSINCAESRRIAPNCAEVRPIIARRTDRLDGRDDEADEDREEVLGREADREALGGGDAIPQERDRRVGRREVPVDGVAGGEV